MQPTIQNAHLAQIHITGLCDFVQLHITNMESGNTLTPRDAKRYSAETIRAYTATLQHIKDFEATLGGTIQMMEIDFTFGEAFSVYLTNQGMAKNSVGLYLSKLKSVLKLAFRRRLSLWDGSGLYCPKEKTTQVALSIDEIRKLRSAQITNGQRKVVDIFIIQCFVGLRYHTLKKFLENPLPYIKEYEGQTYIDITDDKTNVKSTVPLGETVKNLLIENGGSFQMPTEASYINRTIKKIAQKAGLDNLVVLRRTEGGRMVEKMSPKYTKIGSHSARRSMGTNLIKEGHNYNDARVILGHASDKQTKDYIKVDNIDEIKHLLGDKLFDTKI